MKNKNLKHLLLLYLLSSSVFATTIDHKLIPPGPDRFGCLKKIDNRVSGFTLILNDCALTDADMPDLAAYLEKHSNILELYLDNNRDISAAGLNILLPETLHLVTLSINNGFAVGAEGASVIGQMTSLNKLSMRVSNLTAAGAASLMSLSNLKQLDISGNDIKDAGAASIATLSGLTELRADNNNISSNGAVSLAALTSLTYLSLKDNFISDDGAAALVRTGSSSLWGTLDLSSNHIGDAGAAALANNYNFLFLRLEHNDITDVGATSLANNADVNGIFFLDVAFNRIGPAGIAALDAGVANGKIRSYYAFGNLPAFKQAKTKSFAYLPSALKSNFVKFCSDKMNDKICNSFSN